jgi:predicted RNA-binding protein with PUA domain
MHFFLANMSTIVCSCEKCFVVLQCRSAVVPNTFFEMLVSPPAKPRSLVRSVKARVPR